MGRFSRQTWLLVCLWTLCSLLALGAIPAGAQSISSFSPSSPAAGSQMVIRGSGLNTPSISLILYAKDKGARINSWQLQGMIYYRTATEMRVQLASRGGSAVPAGNYTFHLELFPATGSSKVIEMPLTLVPAKTTTIKALLIVKNQTNISASGKIPQVKSTLSAGDKNAIATAFTTYYPYWVSRLTYERVKIDPYVVYSDVPVTTLSLSPAAGNYWVAPADVRSDLNRYVSPGQYDVVFVYWKGIDSSTGKSVPGTNTGWGRGPSNESNKTSYAMINYATADRWTQDSEWTEYFTHEMLHGLEQFYGPKSGVLLPTGADAPLHSNGNKNYDVRFHDRDPVLGGWKHWYEAFLNGKVRDNSNGNWLGLGETAWKYGTVREAAH